MKPLVYLAGPIANTKREESTGWRSVAHTALAVRNIEALSPMRAKEMLARQDNIGDDFHEYEGRGVFFTSFGIMTRDRNDVMRSDALLVNLLGARKQSAGTIMELAWADILRKPVVVAIEKTGNPHDNHPMIHQAMPFRVETLDEAIDAVAVILNR